MKKWILICISAVLSPAGGSVSWAGQASDPNQVDMQQQFLQMQQQMLDMQQKMQDMQQQMQTMQAEHAQEIQVLRDQIGQSDQPEETQTLEEEADLLRRLAQEAAGGEEEPEEKPAEQVKFQFKGLNLRKLNPEISVSGDMVASVTNQEDVRKTTDVDLRSWELSVQSYLDPFSRFKSTIPVDNEGNVGIEEMYFTRYNALGDISLDLGKFRQQFGVINRWHGDALDQVNYPLALQYILGEDGLAQTGASLDLPLPEMGDATQIVTLQLTNSESDHLFGDESMGNPSMLFHYKNYRDLDEDSYAEFGLSGLFGWNDEWQVGPPAAPQRIDDALGTQVFGADFTYVWEPAETAMYRNLEWRSELFFLNRDIYAPNVSAGSRDSLESWGAFSYVQAKIDRNLYLGIRGDYYDADSKSYADTYSDMIQPFAYTASEAYVWQISPYTTIWQSEFVRFHVEYNYTDGHAIQEPGHTVALQAVVAVGPHKHERY